jgi:5-carboxyvanillate decarboxylase
VTNAGAGSLKVHAGRPPLVALEEHFACQPWVDASLAPARSVAPDFDTEVTRALFAGVWREGGELALDIERERLNAMDEAGVRVAVLSHLAPGVQSFDGDTATSLATIMNDHLADVISRHPTRFAGLAVFAPQDPSSATKEIERALTRLKLHGLVVNSHTNGEYLDDKKFWPIFEAAAALDAPIYIHPRNPPREHCRLLLGEGLNLRNVAWGFHMEVGLHIARLIGSGVFDRFPALKIVLGHMGEGIPFYLFRMNALKMCPAKRRPSEYFKENFWITTSGMPLADAALCRPLLKFCREVIGADRIMFASDYPFGMPEDVRRCVFEEAVLPEDDLRKIAYENACKLLGIPVPREEPTRISR